MARMTLADAGVLDDDPADVPAPAPRQAASPPAVPDPVPVPPAKKERQRFTMLQTPAEQEQARRLTAAVVAAAGIRETKSMRADVIRALIAVAAEDERLQRKVAGVLRKSLR